MNITFTTSRMRMVSLTFYKHAKNGINKVVGHYCSKGCKTLSNLFQNWLTDFQARNGFEIVPNLFSKYTQYGSIWMFLKKILGFWDSQVFLTLRK